MTCTPAKSSKAKKKLYVENVRTAYFRVSLGLSKDEAKWPGVLKEHGAMRGTLRERNSMTD